MDQLLVAAGAAIVALTVADIYMTTLTARGAGPLTLYVLESGWGALLAIHRRRTSHRLLAGIGAFMTAGIVVLWTLLLWAGWSLVYNGSETAVLDSRTGDPADTWSRIYFAGFSLFTLGVGDYRPNGAVWQTVRVLTVANGLLAITLSITYLVPVVSAATEKRRLAAAIAGLGRTPEDILRRAWDGESFDAISSHLVALGPMILLQGQRHLAYPALHYFHSADPDTALAPRLAGLYEALLLLQGGVSPEARPRELALAPAMDAIEGFLGSLARAHIAPADDAPPGLPAGRIAATGVPLSNDPAAYSGCLERARDRRRLMLGFVHSDGWTWENVVGGH